MPFSEAGSHDPSLEQFQATGEVAEVTTELPEGLPENVRDFIRPQHEGGQVVSVNVELDAEERVASIDVRKEGLILNGASMGGGSGDPRYNKNEHFAFHYSDGVLQEVVRKLTTDGSMAEQAYYNEASPDNVGNEVRESTLALTPTKPGKLHALVERFLHRKR
ncbi:MAG: hypothetical protein Q8O51_01735 [bacterium]|nr:hypothetical protein [bacterium]